MKSDSSTVGCSTPGMRYSASSAESFYCTVTISLQTKLKRDTEAVHLQLILGYTCVKLRKSYYKDSLTEDVEWIEINRIDRIKRLRIN